MSQNESPYKANELQIKRANSNNGDSEVSDRSIRQGMAAAVTTQEEETRVKGSFELALESRSFNKVRGKSLLIAGTKKLQKGAN